MRENFIYILESLQESYSLKSKAVLCTIPIASLLTFHLQERESHEKMSEHTVAVKSCGLITSRLDLLIVIQIGCQVV